MSNGVTNEHGTTFEIQKIEGERLVTGRNPNFPEHRNEVSFGEVIWNGNSHGFKPTSFPGTLSSSALRIIADLLEQETPND